MKGRVVVDNETGHVIKAQGCGSLFAVALSNDEYQPEIGWRLCLQDLDIPTGISTYPVVLPASTLECTNAPAAGEIPVCSPPNTPPPLETGSYEAKLYQSTHVLPDPPPVRIQVVEASTRSSFSADDLGRALGDAGYDVRPDGTSSGSPLASTAQETCVSGTQVRVYEYADEAARRAVSDGISADGSGIRRGSSHTIVEWVGPPHFFARGRVIALVLQDDGRLLRALEQIMGPTISPDAGKYPSAQARCG
jgi:hypothetical protein